MITMDVKYCNSILGPCMQLTHPECNSFLDINTFQSLKSVLNDFLFLTRLYKSEKLHLEPRRILW